MSDKVIDGTTGAEKASFALLRIGLGWIFFWAFIDKMFGLGFATKPGSSYLNGKSVTEGFLKFGTKGKSLHDFYASIAGNPVVDLLFLLGLLGIGLALILGIGLRIAGVSGIILMLLMWSAQLPLTNNPIFDDHIIYALILLYFFFSPKAGEYYGLGTWWKGIVGNNTWLL